MKVYVTFRGGVEWAKKYIKDWKIVEDVKRNEGKLLTFSEYLVVEVEDKTEDFLKSSFAGYGRFSTAIAEDGSIWITFEDDYD